MFEREREFKPSIEMLVKERREGNEGVCLRGKEICKCCR